MWSNGSDPDNSPPHESSDRANHSDSQQTNSTNEEETQQSATGSMSDSQPHQQSQQSEPPIGDSQPDGGSQEQTEAPTTQQQNDSTTQEPQEGGEDEDESMEETQGVGEGLEELKKLRKPRPKLTFEFFKPKPQQVDVLDPEYDPEHAEAETKEDGDNEDRLWTFFLDVVAQYPTLEEKASLETTEQGRKEIMSSHLDALLTEIRRWSQVNYQCGLSLLEFAEKVEKLSVKQDFHDYRHELLRRYVTTDWREEARTRAEEKRRATELSGLNESFEGMAMDGGNTRNGENDVSRVGAGQVNQRRADEFDQFDYGEGFDDDEWMTRGEKRMDGTREAAAMNMGGNKQTDQAQKGVQSVGVPLDSEALAEMRRRKAEILARKKAAKDMASSSEGGRNISGGNGAASSSSVEFTPGGPQPQSTYTPPPPPVMSRDQLEEMKRKREEALKRQRERLEQLKAQRQTNDSNGIE